MTKRVNEKKGNILMDCNDDSPLSFCSPLSDTPFSSPNSKKTCSRDNDDEVSNADILKAIQHLTSRFVSLEQKISQNTEEIAAIKENIGGIEHMVQTNNDKMQVMSRRLSEHDEKIEDAERYSRRWNLKLFNLPESTNESTEELRRQIFQIFAQMAPDDKNKLGFLVDTIHRVGRPRDDRSPRPVIIQFTMRNFRQKIWKTSMTATVMREKRLRLAEDLTYGERQSRNKLWPLVEKARKDGKKTAWRGPDVIIEGKRITAASMKDVI